MPGHPTESISPESKSLRHSSDEGISRDRLILAPLLSRSEFIATALAKRLHIMSSDISSECVLR